MKESIFFLMISKSAKFINIKNKMKPIRQAFIKVGLFYRFKFYDNSIFLNLKYPFIDRRGITIITKCD